MAMKDNKEHRKNGAVKIKPVDFNGMDQEKFPQENAQAPDLTERKIFTNNVYTNLPELLQVPCSNFSDQNDKDVFLVGALGVVSGILPNVLGMYFTDEVKPNLYCYIMGKYSVGKGAIKLAKKLVSPIHDFLQNQSKQRLVEFKKEFSRYQKQKKKYENDELDSCPDEPLEPAKQKLFLPANISGTAFKQILNDCGGRGIMFETEGDTLANILKQDFGNYSDDLRRAFHNETMAYCRRTGNEDVEIKDPCLSVVISSTFDQLLKLIPSVENGLYSRFNYFEIPPNQIFKNPFSKGDKDLLNLLTEYSEHYFSLFQRLQSLDTPIQFKLTDEQEIIFVKIFQDWKSEISQHLSEDLEGFINRLGNICFRLCMLLSILRVYNKSSLPEQIFCTDQDFDNAFRITDVFKWQAISLFYMISEAPFNNKKVQKIIDKEEAIKRCIELYPSLNSFRKVAKEVLGDAGKKSTVERWLKGM